jgi:hypothetical protein
VAGRKRQGEAFPDVSTGRALRQPGVAAEPDLLEQVWADVAVPSLTMLTMLYAKLTRKTYWPKHFINLEMHAERINFYSIKYKIHFI